MKQLPETTEDGDIGNLPDGVQWVFRVARKGSTHTVIKNMGHIKEHFLTIEQ